MEEKLFSLEKFDLLLDTEWIARNFIYLDEVDSTNSFLLKSKDIKINGSVALSEKQNEGRGRLDRTWLSARGLNLTFSVLFTKLKKIEKLNFLNMGSSLVVAQTLENLYALKTELKWPNDVLINKKKISGILLESVSSGSKITRVVLGIGINVNQPIFHGDFRIEPTSIKIETGNYGDKERILAEVLNRLELMIDKIDENPDSMLDDWRERCRMIGDEVEVRQNDKSKYGIFDDIDKDGNLLLKVKGKIEKINFGDISLT
ncbi:MAG: biotin--[acetyl-CoA-carboxylase] ligase [Ignavibacteriales bacterium]|jgi:BirA family biotin operon repressor/biotin-[acetyl-CoA-carboxylase] ligase|nr:biotin--[acetyl-CoA-carboxylase] ligase [Ignavibacteriaceae bacterium]NLH61472.1 biotin--[acetyl-CoA-carboxylase] ligase [Ignavibacteriales bacterium]HOJ17500.1 biotin--[acetyl-CoA-carboxylase] ligase [Ignavibacteriaceae bacterium]